jgi:outer membrane protein assembly factor BamA
LPFSGRINLLKIGYKYFKLRPSPDWDINPSDGKFIYIQLRRADDLIKSDVNYSEIRARWDNYIAVNHLNHTFMTRLSYGNKYHISNINTPILYGIGGVNTVRGFSTDTRFGTKYAIASAEYRLPLKIGIIRPKMGYFYLNKLFGAIFYDSGNAWYSGKIKYSDFISSYGAELKLKSLLLGKVPIITRLGYAFLGKYGNRGGSYLDFNIPIF